MQQYYNSIQNLITIILFKPSFTTYMFHQTIVNCLNPTESASQSMHSFNSLSSFISVNVAPAIFERSKIVTYIHPMNSDTFFCEDFFHLVEEYVQFHYRR